MTAGYYRYPTIHQDNIVFVSEDDLWGVPVSGGIARRLTSNLGEVTSPMLSSSGTQLAFVGREEGGPEIFVMPAEGGSARRLTYLNSNCQVVGWTQDDVSIVFTSAYGQVNAREMALFTIRADAENGEVTALPYGPARTVTFGPDGAVVLGRNTGDPARWKRYRGGTTGHLWIDRNGDGNFERLLTELQGNIASPMWIHKAGESRIFFISDHEGIGNLYSCLPDGHSLLRHTDHDDYYARNPSSDGTRIIYHAGADIFVFDPATDQTARVDVQYRSSRVRRNRRFVDSGRFMDGYALHPSGKAMAITTRGKVFAFYNHEGPVVQYGHRDGVRYRHATWLEDGRNIAVVTDEPGEETFEIYSPDPTASPRQLENLDLGRVVDVKASPTDNKLAVSNHRNELLIVDLDSSEITIVDQGALERIGGFDWSPDGGWLAYSYSPRINTSEIRLFRVHETEDNEAQEIESQSSEPESATEESDDTADDNGANKSAAPLTERRFTITKPVLHDVQPAFDPDGHFLYFLSHREFNPVYDGLHFDLGFPWGMRPYIITLQADLPNPFTPKPDFEDDDRGEADQGDSDDQAEDDEDFGDDDDLGEQDDETSGDDDEENVRNALDATFDVAAGEATVDGSDSDSQDGVGSDNKKKADGNKERKSPEPIRIDLEGIERRVMPFPVPDARYGQILGIPGKALFTVFPIEGALDSEHLSDDDSPEEGALRAYDFKEYKSETLLEGINDFQLSANHKKLVYRTGSRLRVINAGDKPSSDSNPRKSGWVNMQRIKVSVDPQSEWEQMFREAWRLQRDQFWSEDMSQVDWQIVYQRYFMLIERVSTRSEFSDLMWEMQGELGTSHAYEFGGDYRPRPYYGQGFLGAECTWDAEAGGYRIGEIVQGDSWDERNTSPLAGPGIDIKPGDLLLAVNGQRLNENTSPAQLLVNQAGNEVLLTLSKRDEESDGDAPVAEDDTRKSGDSTTTDDHTRSFVVRSILSEAPARYRRWVETNRAVVHDASDGRVGYVHIPDMGPRGYAEFHRGYLAEVDRDALIVDVRYNGGGHVSQLILEKLARRRLGYDLSRWGGLIPYPIESVAGPLVALTNEQAGSDGDIFCHCFKLMKLGPLIGKRTWGGVVGIYPRHALVDGTITTQPEYSFWFEDVGWDVENYGTDPDIEVDIRPQDYAAQKDPQLDRAVEEILRLLSDFPVKRPEMGPRPSRALPALPPRAPK